MGIQADLSLPSLFWGGVAFERKKIKTRQPPEGEEIADSIYVIEGHCERHQEPAESLLMGKWKTGWKDEKCVEIIQKSLGLNGGI
jgi:hypothetical protein